VNDHQKNEQYSGMREGCAFLTAMSNRCFGMDRYFRTIRSSSRFWLNQCPADWSNYEHRNHRPSTPAETGTLRTPYL
jgi:hypothetical protein